MRTKITGYFSLVVIVVLSVTFMSGCALKAKYLKEDYTPPITIAVLPMANQTNNMTGSLLVRKLFQQIAPKRGYNIITLEEVDLGLKSIGITDGGQLSSVAIEDLAKAIDADAFVYSTLLEFKFITLGIYYKRIVKAHFRMIDAGTGDLLWEDTRKGKTSEFTMDFEKIKEQLAVKLIENIFKSPLKPEAERMVRKVLSTMPKRRK